MRSFLSPRCLLPLVLSLVFSFLLGLRVRLSISKRTAEEIIRREQTSRVLGVGERDVHEDALHDDSVLFAHPLFGNLGVARGVSLLGGLSVIGIIGIWTLFPIPPSTNILQLIKNQKQTTKR
jgi:hypothetical protein